MSDVESSTLISFYSICYEKSCCATGRWNILILQLSGFLRTLSFLFVLNAAFLNPLKRVEGVDKGAERKGALVELMG